MALASQIEKGTGPQLQGILREVLISRLGTKALSYGFGEAGPFE